MATIAGIKDVLAAVIVAVAPTYDASGPPAQSAFVRGTGPFRVGIGPEQERTFRLTSESADVPVVGWLSQPRRRAVITVTIVYSRVQAASGDDTDDRMSSDYELLFAALADQINWTSGLLFVKVGDYIVEDNETMMLMVFDLDVQYTYS